MKNNHKGFLVQGVIAVVAVLLIAGIAYYAGNSKTDSPADQNATTTATSGTASKPAASGTFGVAGKPAVSTTNSTSTASWKTNSAAKSCYSVKYPATFAVYSTDTIANFNVNAFAQLPSKGVKIQVQSERDTRFNTQTEDGFESLITSLNANIKTNSQVENSSITQITKNKIGIFSYKNAVVSGPGGKSDIFYAPSKVPNGYYKVTVWGMENDSATVERILGTFSANACAGAIPAVSSKVHIDTVAPAGVTYGKILTIDGKGFSGHDTLVRIKGTNVNAILWSGVPTSDTRLEITIPVSMDACVEYTGASGKPCSSFQKLPWVTYTVNIENQNGTSNSVSFDLIKS